MCAYLNRRVVFNLSVLIEKPTGHSVCINNIVPSLVNDMSTVLVNEHLRAEWAKDSPANVIPVSEQLSPDSGKSAYLRRLRWNETELPRLVRESRGELVYTPLPEVPLLRKVPTVCTIYDFIPSDHFSKRSPARQYVERYVPQALRRARHVLAISQATADQAIQRCGVPASKISVAPLGYDREVFRFLDLPVQPFILYVGRLAEYKNVGRALSAFARVPGHREYEFVIAGPENHPQSELLRLQALNLNARIRFLPYPDVQNIARLMNEATALIHPSLSEGFGLTVLEAMACGTPVVASKTSSIPEVAGDAALLVDPTDVPALSDVLKQVMCDNKLRMDLRQKGIERAKQFTWENTRQLTAEVLNSF